MDNSNIMVIGDPGVGKTNFIKRMIGENFTIQYIPTIGIDEYKTDRITFYDIAGQEFNSGRIDKLRIKMNKLEINLIIYVYDCTSLTSFKHLEYWKKYNENIPFITISNKIDLKQFSKIVSANENFSVSARTCKNLDFVKNIIGLTVPI